MTLFEWFEIPQIQHSAILSPEEYEAERLRAQEYYDDMHPPQSIKCNWTEEGF